ncbi:hypothetical protein ABT061_46765 [Streptosporangium sp. NPDC002544]|uniref:hypothetical protein n=1 Tax=Streptosporangium sp. NPDC002544 TaxID=3154538 RepID=UPI003316A94E
MSKIRTIRIRWKADAPPLPLGCRWCGHAPYAHDASTLPHRRDHHWEQPTPRQVCARMATRRRLGLCRPLPASARPLKVHPPIVPAQPRPGHHARTMTAPATHGRGRAPDTSPQRRYEPHRREVLA